MLQLILGFVGNWIPGLGKVLVDAYKVKVDAANTSQRIAADLAQRELAVQEKEQEVRGLVLVAEQGHWMTRWVRPIWALPFIIWTWKVVFWDIVMGWGTTPELKGITANLALLIAGAYFIGRSGEKIAQIIKR